MSFFYKFLYHGILAGFKKKSFRNPFGIYIYLTFRCNLNCSYCDGGSGLKFPQMRRSELSLSDWSKILPGLARFSKVLMLSGGEPMMYENITGMIRLARKAGFKFISLNSNGVLLTPEVIDAVDAVIVSLDSLDREKSDQLWHRKGATEKVVGLLENLSGRSHPSIVVNSVIMPENISDVAGVLEFCIERNITFSAGPVLDKTKPSKGLQGNKDYHALMDRILAAKRKGHRIAATVDYLRNVKYFRKFDCHPQLVWRIYPNGDLVFPCSRLNRTIGNLLETTDPISLFRADVGGEFFEPGCTENCPLSCYMDTSTMISRPLSLIREGIYRLRAFSNGHRLLY